MLEDKEFLSSVAELIRENHLTAEKAFEFKTLEVRDLWTAAGSPLLKERLADLTGVAIRVIHHLMHRRGAVDVWESLSEPSILVARELSPGLTVQLDRDKVVGLISEEGTRTSHAAILAHSIGIPAILGVRGAVARIRSEEHTSELQSRLHLVCRLLLEKKKKNRQMNSNAVSL